MMRIATFTTLSLLALAACSPQIPDSAAGVGVMPVTATAGASALPPAAPVATASLDGDAASIAADTTAMLGATGAPLSAMGDGAATATPASISDEQSFAAVSERETIESDAARIAANRAQYVVIQPTDLPPRPDGSGASIVAYALATTNVPGQQLYSRSSFRAETRYQNACARFGSDDRAQEAFLDAGGPERDRHGVDPDGDGFACDWDPRPFRVARQGAPEVVDTYEVVETPGES